MAGNNIDVKVGKLDLVDAFAIGASKVATDVIFDRFSPVGNGNAYSGVAKVIAAMAIGMPSNRWSRDIATGVGLDGVEDFIAVLRNKFNGNKSSNSNVMII